MSFLSGAALLALLTSCWGYIKMYATKLTGLLIVRVKFNGFDYDTENISLFFRNNFKLSSTCEKCFRIHGNTYIKPVSRRGHVFSYDVPQKTIIFWKGIRPIFFNTNENNHKEFSFLRWTFNAEKLVKEIESWINDKKFNSYKTSNNFRVKKFIGEGHSKYSGGNPYSSRNVRGEDAPVPTRESDQDFSLLKFLSWEQKDLGEPEPPNPMALIALNSEAKEAVEEIRRWKENENWYKERSIPWKRGIALTGKPGNGKSSLARILGMELNMRLNVFDISTMNNKEFQEFWKESLEYSPCINLIEDIDAVFDGRKNIVNPETGLTFDCLLNTIDGVENTDGVLTIITTNHVEKLDTAIGNVNGDQISTRPGRIDRVVVMTPPDETGRRMIATRILRDFPEYIEKTIQDGNHDSGAQFQERCSRLALKLFWESKNT